MKVTVVLPDGSAHDTMLRDGERTEVSAGEQTFVRIRRVSPKHLRVELWPAAEPVRREKLRLVRP